MSFCGNSSNFQVNVNNSHLVAAESVHYHGSRTGLGRLYDESLPDAIHNSAARSLADITLPISQHTGIVEGLATLFSQPQDPLLPNVVVVNGPKSNLAEICAEELEEYSCATFFVSKQLGTDNPAKLFTTIAHQLAVHFRPYASLLEAKIRRNPSLLRMSLELQFKELIVEPIQQLLDQAPTDFSSPRKLIIIDGLDEYANPRARSKILRIILQSAEKLPFVWLLSTQSNVDGILDALPTTGRVGRPARVRFFGDSKRSGIAFSNESICVVTLAQRGYRIAGGMRFFFFI